MRTGVLLLQDVPWSLLRERAVRAEAMGFDAIWVADHLVEPYRPDVNWSEAWTLLGALAASTTRATLGALTSSLTLRNPTLLVQAAQTLRNISSDRAELALGAGGAPLDHQMTGTPMWTPSERAEHFAEFVPLVSNILRSGGLPAGTTTTHFPVEGVRLPASGGVRLTVAALGPQSIVLAARYGDAWNSYGVPTGKRLTSRLTHEQALDLFRARKARFDRSCVAAGRDPASIATSYTWVESYVEPGLSNLNAGVAVARDFRAAGVSEFIIYWPKEASQEANLAEFARIIRDI